MHEVVEFLVGPHASSHSITTVQLCFRAVVVFFAALLMLRLSGKRTFGGNSPFDMVIKIMLGAVLSRAIVAASPFGGTLLAGLVLVLLHRLLAYAAFRSSTIGQLIKGQSFVLAENGQLNEENMRHNSISEKDLLEGLRQNGNIASLEQAQTVCLERGGEISVVKKPR